MMTNRATGISSWVSLVLRCVIPASIVLTGCGEAPYKAPDVEPPSIRITYPPSGTIIGRYVKVRAEAFDDELVTEVRFFFDGGYVGKDLYAPYEFGIRPAPEIISTHQVHAVACDMWGNESVSEPTTVRFGWSHAFWDPNDSWLADLRSFYLRSDSSWLYLQFQIDSFVDSDETKPQTVEMYLFVDADCDSTTGESSNRIGADYVLLFYWMLDSLYHYELLEWNGEWELWEYASVVQVIEVSKAQPTLRAAVRLADIGQPDSLHAVVTNIVHKGRVFIDRMPDIPNRCYECRVDRQYLGEGL
jgi:hypothetical protein